MDKTQTTDTYDNGNEEQREIHQFAFDVAMRSLKLAFPGKADSQITPCAMNIALGMRRFVLKEEPCPTNH